MAPAGFARRYAAWSLDAAAIAALATPLAWPVLGPAGRALGRAAGALASGTGDALFAGLLAGRPLPVLVRALLDDPVLRAAAGAVQSALGDVMGAGVLAYAAIALPWHVAGTASRWQASPGKRAFGLVVVAADGSRPGAMRAAGRHLSAALSWLSLNVGHLLALGPARAALHDRIAHTRVARRHAGLPAPAVWGWIVVQAVGGGLLGWRALRALAAGLAGTA